MQAAIRNQQHAALMAFAFHALWRCAENVRGPAHMTNKPAFDAFPIHGVFSVVSLVVSVVTVAVTVFVSVTTVGSGDCLR